MYVIMPIGVCLVRVYNIRTHHAGRRMTLYSHNKETC